MRATRLDRADARADRLLGRILCRDLRAADGGVLARKGRVLEEGDVARILGGTWSVAHVAELEPHEVHEGPAGERVAGRLAAGGVRVGEFAGGYWPLVAGRRGVLQVDVEGLFSVNRVDGVACCTLLDGQVVDEGELLARIKVVPFALAEARLEEAEEAAGDGLLTVRKLPERTVGAIAVETLPNARAERFTASLTEKLGWLGSRLLPPRFAAEDPDEIAEALRGLLDAGAEVILLAGSRSMDPLDPALTALDGVQAHLVRHGAPAFPGTLLWLARAGTVPILGLPSCGIFSKPTVVDTILPRLLLGETPGYDDFAALGHGGLLRPESAFRMPAYRQESERGSLQ